MAERELPVVPAPRELDDGPVVRRDGRARIVTVQWGGLDTRGYFALRILLISNELVGYPDGISLPKARRTCGPRKQGARRHAGRWDLHADLDEVGSTWTCTRSPDASPSEPRGGRPLVAPDATERPNPTAGPGRPGPVPWGHKGHERRTRMTTMPVDRPETILVQGMT